MATLGDRLTAVLKFAKFHLRGLEKYYNVIVGIYMGDRGAGWSGNSLRGIVDRIKSA
jgi:hypothetical protein